MWGSVWEGPTGLCWVTLCGDAALGWGREGHGGRGSAFLLPLVPGALHSFSNPHNSPRLNIDFPV